jgi:hypothetical protein
VRPLVTLWVGDALGSLERACLKSMVRQGHDVTLYSYGTPEGIPQGVSRADGCEILPETSIFRNPEGSVALFSDWFRYELLRRGAGTWIDTDVYLVAPVDMDAPNLFAEQAPGVLNNAILRLPPDSPLLPELLAVFERGEVPAWLPMRRKTAAHLRRAFSGGAAIPRLPWGSTGPHALTALARKHGLFQQALPVDVFYPVPWRKAAWIVDPSISLTDVVTPRTVGVHLWNECIRSFKDTPAAKGSFLDRLQQEGR